MRTSASPQIETAGLLIVFVALTCKMMWPIVGHISDHAVEHQDVYFNMWRLEWVAHALATSPSNLFNANIFYREPRTLLFSDAMLVQGVTASPLIWLGLPPVLVHNLMLLAAIVASALAMWTLVRHLTGSRGAALLAGVIFAFAPYRYAHVMHMELQWTMWTPLAFLAMHRTLERGRVRDGLFTGLAVVLQMLSSIYYGVFLVTLLPLCGVLLKFGERWTLVRRAIVPLTAGALLALAIVSVVYGVAYLHARDRVGEREPEQIRIFTARPADYLVTGQRNWLYGEWQEPSNQERRLFPGAVAGLLALIGVLLRVPSRTIVVYVLGAVAAFEASLGFQGYLYSFLYDHVSAFHALRAPARLGIFVVFFIATLAGFGYRYLASSLGARARVTLLVVLTAAVLVESSTAMTVVAYPNTAPPVYRLLATQPRGVVAEFPMPKVNSLPGDDAKYAYMSIFHWKPLVNGYSGFYPPTYIRRLLDVRGFPDRFAVRVLRQDGVRYIVVHEHGYGADQEAYETVISTLDATAEILNLGTFSDGEGDATVYVFREIGE